MTGGYAAAAELRFCRALQPGLNTAGQSAKVGDALQFVVRKLDRKVALQTSEQFECLKTVNAQGLEEIIVGGKLFARNFEMGGGEI